MEKVVGLDAPNKYLSFRIGCETGPVEMLNIREYRRYWKLLVKNGVIILVPKEVNDGKVSTPV